MTGGIIEGNYTTGQGAGVNVLTAGSIVNITGGKFENNVAATSNGGALRLGAACTATVENVTFTGNVAGSHGGAIRIQDFVVNATIKNCKFESNTAKYGGAISNAATKDGASVVLIGNEFKKNVATDGGGAINLAGAVKCVTLNNNTFTDNTGPKTGKDVRVDNKDAQVYLSGTNSFEAYLYKTPVAALNLNADFNTNSVITLICNDTQSAGNTLVKCANADLAKDALKCFKLSGANLTDFDLRVSDTNLVLVEKTNTVLASLMSLFTN